MVMVTVMVVTEGAAAGSYYSRLDGCGRLKSFHEVTGGDIVGFGVRRRRLVAVLPPYMQNHIHSYGDSYYSSSRKEIER